jgi:tRNA A37 threonylcarbamoyladenosine biosynthesis protein TsaE
MDIEIKKDIFKEIGKDFLDFLYKEDNERIIFSGKYGSGKTTFLKWFFDDPRLSVECLNKKVLLS